MCPSFMCMAPFSLPSSSCAAHLRLCCLMLLLMSPSGAAHIWLLFFPVLPLPCKPWCARCCGKFSHVFPNFLYSSFGRVWSICQPVDLMSGWMLTLPFQHAPQSAYNFVYIIRPWPDSGHWWQTLAPVLSSNLTSHLGHTMQYSYSVLPKFIYKVHDRNGCA